MGRIIHTDSPTTVRNRNRRTIAEMLKRLAQKPEIDDEAKDFAATIVFELIAIDEGVLSSAKSWEKRDYWIKAEKFIREWAWAKETAYNLDDVLRHEAWDLLPRLILELYPKFADVKVTKLTRKADVWEGNYMKLILGEAVEPPF